MTTVTKNRRIRMPHPSRPAEHGHGQTNDSHHAPARGLWTEAVSMREMLTMCNSIRRVLMSCTPDRRFEPLIAHDFKTRTRAWRCAAAHGVARPLDARLREG